MSFTADGLIRQFLDVLGVTIETASGHNIAFLAFAALFGLCITAFMAEQKIELIDIYVFTS